MDVEGSTQCESLKTVLSHYESVPLSTKKQHERQCRGIFPNARTLRYDSRTLFMLLVALLSWSSLVTATEAHGDRPALRVEDDLAWTGSSLYLDQRPPPIVPLLMPPLPDFEDATRTRDAPPSRRAIATDPKVSATDFAIPKPFDTGLSNNFTSPCTTFLNRLRASDAFNNCHPFSLMLQTSSGFFDASKSFLRITQTLDATCAVNATQCKTTLDGFARDLLSTTACKTDYNSDNPLVLQAYNGLVAYQPSYLASCLRDDAGSYCFANAVSNSSSTTDSYPYYLPIGQPLPGGSRPTCNSCLQDAMGVFSHYANNATQPLSKTYSLAAQQISVSCGKAFVNVTAAPLKGAAASTSAPLTPTITLILMFIFYIFQ